ncbi:AraC family transcriptional regulator [Sphingosinicella sp. LHD-64]|uniref:AraC family transcriptional regulator n=1 Tax=Sphingosinicella sp. LHD-64 TaxID=3072139 RepID=UPI0028108669|nr:AraC family transcriptional regulator [Sphingosinicella sp. LHD-64]MDQ8754930.1 AraC family transcriptional regulator [Sphingosinicella sp. LHD-64]
MASVFTIARRSDVGRLIDQPGRTVEELLAESRAPMEGIEAAKASTRHGLFERLERARSHLHCHDGRAVSLVELASVAGLSQFHLARSFKRAFGQAPIAYHRTLRLERAARLLAWGNCPLAEVAERTGYSDEVALSHAFRRHFGRAPALWAAERRADLKRPAGSVPRHPSL